MRGVKRRRAEVLTSLCPTDQIRAPARRTWTLGTSTVTQARQRFNTEKMIEVAYCDLDCLLPCSGSHRFPLRRNAPGLRTLDRQFDRVARTYWFEYEHCRCTNIGAVRGEGLNTDFTKAGAV